MEVIVKDGEEIKQYKSTGEIGSGEGTRAGVAYQMADGSLVYVPEGKEESAKDKAVGVNSDVEKGLHAVSMLGASSFHYGDGAGQR